MKQYKQKEVAKLEGVDPRSVSRWTDDDLQAKGWTKHGEGNGCYYTRDQDGEVDGVVTTRQDLEIRKLKAEIALKEQQSRDKERESFRKWTMLFLDTWYEEQGEFSETKARLKFTEEQSELWNDLSEEFMKRFGKALELACESVHTKDL